MLWSTRRFQEASAAQPKSRINYLIYAHARWIMCRSSAFFQDSKTNLRVSNTINSYENFASDTSWNRFNNNFGEGFRIWVLFRILNMTDLHFMSMNIWGTRYDQNYPGMSHFIRWCDNILIYDKIAEGTLYFQPLYCW